MQKYADLNRTSHFGKVGGKLVTTTNKRKRSTRRKKSGEHTKLWLVTFFLIVTCLGYIRYQALYIENSVFRDLYKLVYEHFLSKDPLPPISTEMLDDIPGDTVVTSLPVKPDKIITAKKTTETKLNQEKVTKVARSNPREKFAEVSGVDKSVASVNIMPVGFYYPYLDFDKDIIKFIVVSKSVNLDKLIVGEGSYVGADNKLLAKYLVKNLVKYKSKSRNIKNIFHSKTSLLDAWVENGTLILNFNSYLERSKFGYKGMEIRVQQILWTFLNLPKSETSPFYYISILVNGERKERLGGDGFTLKPFYSKKDLRTKVLFP